MKKKIRIRNFNFDPLEMTRQFMIVINRSGGEEILEHTRQILLYAISRADKPEVFESMLKLLTLSKDGYDVIIEKATELPDGSAAALPASDVRVPEGKSPEDILPKGSVKYLRRLAKLGFLDKDFQLIKEPAEKPTTRSEAMYIVYSIHKALGKDKIRWKPFEEFWGISNLAQEKWKWENRMSMSPRRKLIDKAFEDY